MAYSKEFKLRVIKHASLGQNSKQSDNFYNQYFKKVAQKGYKQKIILNENVRGYKDRTDYYERSKLHEVKYLYKNTFVKFNFYKDTFY